jgi:phosphatidylserine decarboxylase
VLQFFRDPAREIPSDPRAVLSPADGRIVVIEKAIDPYRQQEALKISVFMNVFNVHSNRTPVDGTVERVEYHAGSFLNASLAKASLENERNAVLLKTPEGVEITFVQIAGLVARRILCYVKAGDALSRGQRYGFIRFGSRVDVYLPLTATAKVAIGDKVSATCTVLATLD